MVKRITNIFLNSDIALKQGQGSYDGQILEIDGVATAGRIYSLFLEIPPIIIRNQANLKVANICHMGTGHGDKIIYFKIDGIMTDNNRCLSNDGGIPTILATTFNNTRNLYEENDIPLVRQTINTIRLYISDDLLNPLAGIENTMKFCIALKLEEEVNE